MKRLFAIFWGTFNRSPLAQLLEQEPELLAPPKVRWWEEKLEPIQDSDQEQGENNE